MPFVLLAGCIATVAAIVDTPSTPTAAPTMSSGSQATEDAAPTPEQTTETAEPSSPPKPEPKAKTYKGSGSKVVRIQPTSDIRLVTSTARGSSNFIVYGVGPDGEERDLLANDIGNHRGTRLMNLDGEETVALKVEAEGTWTIAVKPVTSARRWTKPRLAGAGDDVVYLDPNSSGFQTITSKFAGEGNFVVYGYDGDGNESLLANEIDKSEAETTLPDSTFLVTIEGDGRWTLERTGI
ncbi:hypothetical protein Pth03_45080 [Planotetraspora thailandica]|uniref:Uncharacterized protein n=2 Tax=Planotetraspora thailandica TaxID=487172 RepID=A0A8J3XX32_9ACTN|nr:hypothetical protein Pth03_45080 [Planotetraspora thailandica]